MKWQVSFYWIFAAFLLLAACKSKETTSTEQDLAEEVITAPAFSSDSAFSYIEKQVAFGPRVPGTSAHQLCADWLIGKLESFGAKVTVQRTIVTAHDGKLLPCINIIGSYNPESAARMILAAHWDTRPRADQDVRDTDKPIDGANDGASGVGVLLEIARQFQQNPPENGIDIIFFDVEDYSVSGEEDSYCLGSQYWAKNPHLPGYRANAGILLDMVGAKDARFTMEGSSMQINPDFVRQIWRKGHALGHGRYFLFRETPAIIDDHVYVYKFTRIPMIDIIQFDPTTPTGFGRYWHTHQDNMSVISKETLQAVGETVIAIAIEF
jgi:hypothetical protein